MGIEARKYQIMEKVFLLDELGLSKLESYLEQDDVISEMLDKALSEVREGKVTSHGEVRKKYEKWL